MPSVSEIFTGADIWPAMMGKRNTTLNISLNFPPFMPSTQPSPQPAPIDWNDVSSHVPKALDRFEKKLSDRLTFSLPPPLTLTPDKGYSAKSDAKVLLDGIVESTMTIVAFLPQDGTGNEDDYKLSDSRIELPERVRQLLNPGKLVPRKKNDLVLEAFFPLFLYTDRLAFYHSVSLEEFTLIEGKDGRSKLEKLWTLGISARDISSKFPALKDEDPLIQFTVGRYLEANERFGDPHSIFFGLSTKYTASTPIQVAGFVPVRDRSSPLATFLISEAQLRPFKLQPYKTSTL